MRGSRNFRQWGGGGGGPGQSDQKALTTFVFLVLSLFYRSQMFDFKENYHFSRFRRGPTFSRGVQLFPGGSNCLFPIETHITCDFPGGSGPPAPPPPLDTHLRQPFSYVFYLSLCPRHDNGQGIKCYPCPSTYVITYVCPDDVRSLTRIFFIRIL